MNKNSQPFETREHDLTGYAALDLNNKDDFNSFAARIAGYEPARFSPVAIKVFAENQEVIVTLYALDRSAELKAGDEKTLPVKKFKLRMDWGLFLSQIKRFDLIVSDGVHQIADMVVTNK
jgi:hypothetical protein